MPSAGSDGRFSEFGERVMTEKSRFCFSSASKGRAALEAV